MAREEASHLWAFSASMRACSGMLFLYNILCTNSPYYQILSEKSRKMRNSYEEILSKKMSASKVLCSPILERGGCFCTVFQTFGDCIKKKVREIFLMIFTAGKAVCFYNSRCYVAAVEGTIRAGYCQAALIWPGRSFLFNCDTACSDRHRHPSPVEPSTSKT